MTRTSGFLFPRFPFRSMCIFVGGQGKQGQGGVLWEQQRKQGRVVRGGETASCEEEDTRHMRRRTHVI
jgi:hypothetical protein